MVLCFERIKLIRGIKLLWINLWTDPFFISELCNFKGRPLSLHNSSVLETYLPFCPSAIISNLQLSVIFDVACPGSNFVVFQ